MISAKEALLSVAKQIGHVDGLKTISGGKYFLIVSREKNSMMDPILFDRETGKARAFFPPTEPKEILSLFETG